MTKLAFCHCSIGAQTWQGDSDLNTTVLLIATNGKCIALVLCFPFIPIGRISQKEEIHAEIMI